MEFLTELSTFMSHNLLNIIPTCKKAFNETRKYESERMHTKLYSNSEGDFTEIAQTPISVKFKEAGQRPSQEDFCPASLIVITLL